METFVITLSAKPGAEDKVADFYVSQQAEYDNADGFISRQLLKAKTGTMLEAVKQRYTAEELAKHPEQGHSHDEPATHFIIIEQWESVDKRMEFSQSRDKGPERELFPNLMPDHTHEFYTDITP
ncbi:MAG: hypothetical protein HKN56_10355 [Gammaproteobacteria bacterium]|nr:hypothetical protein [Gammaproteobacteria bacterium]